MFVGWFFAEMGTLAQVTLQDLSRGFRSRDSNFQIWFVLFLVVLAVVIGLLLVLAVRRERRGRVYSRPKLFSELCAAHELPWSQRWLLQELAELANAEGPEVLFVRPDLLALAVDRWRRKYPRKSDDTVVSLQRLLFTTNKSATDSVPPADSKPASDSSPAWEPVE